MKMIYSLFISIGFVVGAANAQSVPSSQRQSIMPQATSFSVYKAQLNSLQGFIEQADSIALAVLNDPHSPVCAYENSVLAMADQFPSNLLNFDNLPSNLPGSLAQDIRTASIELRNIINSARNSDCPDRAVGKKDHCCRESTDPTENSNCIAHIGDTCIQMGYRPRGCSSSGDDCP